MNARKKIIKSFITMFSMILIVVFALVITISAKTSQSANAEAFKSYGVAATITGNYYVGSNSYKLMNEENDSIVFDSYDEESSPSLDQTEPICLSSTNNYVVFEYKFVNNSEQVSFVANLSNTVEVENMDISYGYSYKKLSSYENVKYDVLESVPLIYGNGNTLYFYIKVKVSDLNRSSNLKGSFCFSLISEDVYKLNLMDGRLNNKTYVAYGYQVNSVEVPQFAGLKFQGYFTGLNGTGDRIFDENGNSDLIWEQDSGDTLYAHYTRV